MLLAIFKFGHAAVAAASMLAFRSSEGAVPVSVMVSPLRSKLKSGTSTAASKNKPSLEKSGALTAALIVRLSVRLMSGPNALRRASSSDVFAVTSVSSPLSEMSLPLRTIDSGANDGPGGLTLGAFTEGAVRVADGLTFGRVSSASLFDRFSPLQPIKPNASGTATSANNHPRPGGRR